MNYDLDGSRHVQAGPSRVDPPENFTPQNNEWEAGNAPISGMNPRFSSDGVVALIVRLES